MMLEQSDTPTAKLALKARAFTEECFETCWLMCVQDPPVVIDFNDSEGKPFNTAHYKAYTKSGSVIEYVVWPALFLHQGGSLLCKGVAQGTKEL